MPGAVRLTFRTSKGGLLRSSASVSTVRPMEGIVGAGGS